MARLAKIVHGIYRRNCKRKNIKLNLTVNEVMELITQKCSYCGKVPSNSYIAHGVFVGFYQGIDRKDNTLGYSKENVVPCCIQCNRIKSNALTHDEMKAVAIALASFRLHSGDLKSAPELHSLLASTLHAKSKTRKKA